jgi:hypothetical protein
MDVDNARPQSYEMVSPEWFPLQVIGLAGSTVNGPRWSIRATIRQVERVI